MSTAEAASRARPLTASRRGKTSRPTLVGVRTPARAAQRKARGQFERQSPYQRGSGNPGVGREGTTDTHAAHRPEALAVGLVGRSVQRGGSRGVQVSGG